MDLLVLDCFIIVGSWFCPCTGASLLMVNAWVQSVMKSPYSRIPSWTEFSLIDFTCSSTSSDNDGRELSNTLCKVCKDAKKHLKDKKV